MFEQIVEKLLADVAGDGATPKRKTVVANEMRNGATTFSNVTNTGEIYVGNQFKTEGPPKRDD